MKKGRLNVRRKQDYNSESNLITPKCIKNAWPVLDALPFPVMHIDSDYRVIASNRMAAQEYASVEGCCHQISHGYDTPCDENGEHCPKQDAELSGRPVAVLHVHQIKTGVERYKIQCLPILGGGILEFHIPLRDVTTIDGLTGLTNRTEGEQIVRRALALMHRMKSGYALVMLDLDKFKNVNDTFGHEAGDCVLAAFAEVLRNTVRKTDVAVRWGGEEFLVMLHGADQTAAERFANRVLDGTRNLSVSFDGKILTVTVSAGIRFVRADESQSITFDQALKDADNALYEAKKAGRDRYHMHNE
ncbi:MAG: GGDEF domain-containing protein [Gammaproteobacteria bacterium]|nr:GGDEF domain-containing protein [Gammaproteobacteria bacterium]